MNPRMEHQAGTTRPWVLLPLFGLGALGVWSLERSRPQRVRESLLTGNAWGLEVQMSLGLS